MGGDLAWFQKRKRQFDFRNPKIMSTTTKDKTVTFKTVYIWLILIIVLIGYGIWWLFYGDFFKIKNIEVSGDINESIQSEIQMFKNQNILLFVVGQKDKELAAKQTSIDQINIIKGIPDTLKIEVSIRKPVIRWKSKDKEYFIDQEGVIFELSNPNENDKLKPLIIDSKNLEVSLGKKIVSNDFIDFIVKINSQLPEKTSKKIQEIKINDTTLDIEVQFDNSYKVFLSSINNADNQIYLLQKVIEKHDSEIKEYIDLRVDKRAYYK